MLPRVATQERTEVFSAKPCGPYLYVRAPVTRASGVRHQVLCRRRARAHVLKALAGHEPMAFFALPERLRLQTEHVDVDVVDVSSPTSRTEIPDEDTPAPVGSLRVNYRSIMARSRSSYNPLASSSCANFLERRQHELRRINLPRTPLNRGEKKAHEVLCKRQLEGGGLEMLGAGNKSTVVRGKRETIRW